MNVHGPIRRRLGAWRLRLPGQGALEATLRPRGADLWPAVLGEADRLPAPGDRVPQGEPGTLRAQRQHIEALIKAGESKKPERGVRLMPGTVLTREYQGVEHRITVTLDGR